MKLYFARHGESEANVQQVFWNQPEKYGLTDKGKEQAYNLVGNLDSIAFSAIYCSPVLRAVQTAGIVGSRLDLTPEVADGLREWDVGIIEGKKYNQETQALHWQVTAQWMKHDNHDAQIEGGESYTDIAGRFIPFINTLQETYGSTDTNVLLISHGGTLACMLPLLLSNVDKAFSLHRSIGYTTLIVTELIDGEWSCLRWGEEIL